MSTTAAITKPRVAIIGMGPMGTLMAESLVRAHVCSDILLVGGNKEHIDAMSGQCGVLLRGEEGKEPCSWDMSSCKSLFVRMRDLGLAIDDVGKLAETARVSIPEAYLNSCDVAVVLGKYVNRNRVPAAIASALLKQDSEKSELLALQNGWGAGPALADALKELKWPGAANVYAGILVAGGYLDAARPGRIFCPCQMRATLSNIPVAAIGSPANPECGHVVRLIRGMQEQNTADVTMVDDINQSIFQKLVVNAVVNPVTALLGKHNKIFLESEHVQQLAKDIVQECIAVGKAEGIAVGDIDSNYKKVLQVCEGTRNNKTSMLVSAIAGRETEVENINGAIVALGQKHGVPTPINSTLLHLMMAGPRPMDPSETGH
eukprot:Clim_evm18s217 gene=Clim_evmTU18s217